MEIIAKITKIGAMNERQYTNRQTGQVETFRTVGVWLYRGGDLIYCEAVQENASKLIEAQVQNDLQNTTCFLRLTSMVRDYTDRNNEVHYTTEMRLQAWEKL